MRVFHRTRTRSAAVILKEGFRDGQGRYLTDRMWSGVWVSDRPLDCYEGAEGDVLLALDIPEDVFGEYEWGEEFKTYRESLIPAATLNRFGPPVIATEDDSVIPS